VAEARLEVRLRVAARKQDCHERVRIG